MNVQANGNVSTEPCFWYIYVFMANGKKASMVTSSKTRVILEQALFCKLYFRLSKILNERVNKHRRLHYYARLRRVSLYSNGYALQHSARIKESQPLLCPSSGYIFVSMAKKTRSPYFTSKIILQCSNGYIF